MLRNPAQATTSNLDGIAYVISRMDWYCALTKHLLNKDNIAAGNEFQAILRRLEETIVELYKALLLYQMKSVCSYYRNQGLVFLRSMLTLDDWDGDLKLVTDAEAIIQKDAAQYFQEQTKNSLGKLVELAKEMGTQLGDIHRTLQVFISSQKDARMDDIEAACHRDLFIIDPHHDMERIEENKDKLLDDAYKWILRTQEYAAFTNWDDSGSDCPPRRLLWIKGDAGTGKTMLMIGLTRQLSHQSSALAPALSFFFCQGTDTALNNATAIIRSLIWLLLLQQPRLISHLLQKHKVSGADLFTGRNAWFALSEAFQNMVKDPGLLPVYFAVDALDECEEGSSHLIRLISTSLSLSEKVRWLVSSRPTVKLTNADTTRMLLELDTQTLERPVSIYIDHKLAALRYRVGYDENTLATISTTIHERAQNTFLWVALVFKELESNHGYHAVDIIKALPPGLPKLYGHMMTKIENGNKRQIEYCKSVLAATCLAYRPLSVSELAVVATLPSKIKPQDIVEECGSFLTTRGETVYLIHQSAKDWLKESQNSEQGHADIATRSIDAMSSMLRQNIYNLVDFGPKPSDITLPNPDPLTPIRYSCLFWADHLCSLDSKNPRCLEELADDGKLFGFLKEHFLHWLESLSLLGKLSDGVQSIRKLLHIAQVCL